MAILTAAIGNDAETITLGHLLMILMIVAIVFAIIIWFSETLALELMTVSSYMDFTVVLYELFRSKIDHVCNFLKALMMGELMQQFERYLY